MTRIIVKHAQEPDIPGGMEEIVARVVPVPPYNLSPDFFPVQFRAVKSVTNDIRTFFNMVDQNGVFINRVNFFFHLFDAFL